MKVQIKQLRPNPHRGSYINRAKVAMLKKSIDETTFWDNVLCRPHPEEKGAYQIARQSRKSPETPVAKIHFLDTDDTRQLFHTTCRRTMEKV